MPGAIFGRHGVKEVEDVGRHCYWCPGGRDLDAANHPIMHRTAPTTKDLS